MGPRELAASNDSALRYEQLQTDLGEGPCRLDYDTGEPTLVPDLSVEHRFPSFVNAALDAGLKAVFAFPLGHGGRRLATLDLYRHTTGPLSSTSLETAQTLADVTAAYLLNAQTRIDLTQSAARSLEASLHDALTGLLNRTLILDRLEHAFRRSRRSGEVSAVFFVDLDRFKSINDMYGHRVGDELLVAVANRLTGLLRPDDTLARLSGDEFLICAKDCSTVPARIRSSPASRTA